MSKGLEARIVRLEQQHRVGVPKDVVVLRSFAGERLTAIQSDVGLIPRLPAESEDGLLARVEAGLTMPFNVLREVR